MFTGIIEETGETIALDRREGGARLALRGLVVTEGARPGDSIAVNGCCLTITQLEGGRMTFDILEETLRRTNLGTLVPGARVNLERSLRADQRLGGHFVQGHIDCASAVIDFSLVENNHRLELELPAEFARYVTFKGSIAVNGVSLTVAQVLDKSFVVWIIPHTLSVTNLGNLRSQDRVNLEFDLLAKYTERLLARTDSLVIFPLPA